MSYPIKLNRESKAFIALLCAVSSLMAAAIDNILLSMYKFPSYRALRLIQIITTLIVLWTGRRADFVCLPQLDINVVSRVWPLPLLSFGIMATSHGHALDLNVPSSMVWRPVSVLVTLIFENAVLGIEASCSVQTSVVAMVGGAMIASADGEDAIIWSEYVLILLNNVYLALIGVYSKKILDSKLCGVCGLLYIDSLFMVLPALMVTCSAEELYTLTAYEAWGDPFLLGHIIMSSVMGVIQAFGVILCTQYNSTLTTSVIGSLVCVFKYLLTDFSIISWLKLSGIIVTVCGSLMYAS